MKLKFFIAGALALTVFASCGNGAGGGSATDTASQAAKDTMSHSDEIIISSEKAKAMELATETVKSRPFCGIIPVGGKIIEASGDETTLVASTSGVVDFSRQLTDGTRLSKGSPVMAITASHLQGGSPAGNAKIAYDAARKDYERAAKMIKDNIISKKEFNAIKAQYESARNAYTATPDNGSGGVTIVAPISGYVKACNVKDGDYVSVGQPLLSITQNRRLYLRADLPQRYYESLGSISSAKFKPSYSDRVYDISQLNGKLVATGKSSTSTPGYIPVTFVFNNTGGIVPGAYTDIWLLTAADRQALTLPLTAITEEQGSHFVYIKTDATCYKKQEVRVGDSDGSRIEITSGIKEGDKVVTKGTVNVKLAAASTAIPAHTHNH